MTDTLDVMFDKLRDAAAGHDDDYHIEVQRRPEGSFG